MKTRRRLHRFGCFLAFACAVGASGCSPDGDGTTPASWWRSLFAVRTEIQNETSIPYVVIRHDRPGIAYEDALYTALVRALERYPDARFDVVLALPRTRKGGDPVETLSKGERQIEEVVWAMTDMGLPAERLYIAARTDETSTFNEIRIFVH